MTCNKCGAVLPDNSKFCSKCGNKTDVPAPANKPAEKNTAVCPKCGRALKNGAKFCVSCGTKIMDNTPQKNNNAAGGASAENKPQNVQRPQNQQNVQNPQNVQRPQNMQNSQNVQRPQNPQNMQNQQNVQRPQNPQNIQNQQNVQRPQNPQNMNVQRPQNQQNMQRPQNVQKPQDQKNAPAGHSSSNAAAAGKGRSKALLIVLIVAAVVLIAAGIVLFFVYRKMNDISIDKVKGGYFEEFPDITIGELLDDIHKKPGSKNDDPVWTEKKSLSGCTVQFEGENVYEGFNVEVHFVNNDDGKLEVNYVNIDDEETDADELIIYIEEVYREHLGKNLRDDDRHPLPTTETVTTSAPETTAPVIFTTAQTTTTTVKEITVDFGLLGKSFDTIVSIYGEPEQVVPSPTPEDSYIAYKYGKVFFYSDKWFSGGAVDRKSDVVKKIAAEDGAMLSRNINTDNMMKHVESYESISGAGGSAGLIPAGKGVITIDGVKLSFEVKEKDGNKKFDGDTLYEFVKYEKPAETVPPTTVQENIMPFTVKKKGQINCHGGTVPGYTTSYVTGEGGDTYVRHSLGDTWHVTAKSCCIMDGVTWYELWDTDDGDYYGWVDSRNIDFY